MEDFTSNLREQLQEIDDRINELENDVAMGEALERLKENEDFKKLILEGYFDKEATRIMGVLTEPLKFKREVMENLQDKMASIRNLKEFLQIKEQNARFAREQIEEEKQYRKDVTEANSQEASLVEGGE